MTMTLNVYEKSMPDSLTWSVKLRAAAQAGFDGLEMSIDESDARLSRLDWTEKERLMLLNDCHAEGMPIRSICLSGNRRYPLGSGCPETEAHGLEIALKAIRLAADLGIRIIQLAGYDVYYNEISLPSTRERFLRNLRRICTTHLNHTKATRM